MLKSIKVELPQQEVLQQKSLANRNRSPTEIARQQKSFYNEKTVQDGFL
jgi:hypothetical protein